MNEEIPSDLIHAAFFFVDIVSLSNPELATETQRTKIKRLNEEIYSCETFLSVSKENLFVLPTGDGMLIGFKDGLEEPVKLAKELHEKLQNYNLQVPRTEKIEIRIGCNIGHVFVIQDTFGNTNLWGPGAILARRVMDLGNANHILLTSYLANDLIEISTKYEQDLHPIQDHTIKHGDEILLYSAFGESFGNSIPPKKNMINIIPKNTDNQENPICKQIIFNLKLKDSKTNFFKHERIYHFTNHSTVPIYDLNIGITSNSAVEFANLHVKISDENNNEFKISKIFSHSPFSKEILIKLDPPIFEGQSDKILKIQYDICESNSYFENLFLNQTQKIEINFILGSNLNITPKLYYICREKNVKTILSEPKKTLIGISSIIQWEKNDGIDKSDILRLEW